MPITVGYEWFKKILGTGIKNNLFFIRFDDLYKTVIKIKKSQIVYNTTATGSFEGLSNKNSTTRIVKDFPAILQGYFASLCKTGSYPSEGFDILTNSYYTRKTPGKINLSPLTLTFIIDAKYQVYNIFNYVKNGILHDKKNGIYNYPENYLMEKISIATFNPAVYSNIKGISLYNVPIYIKNYNNCFVSSVGEVTKDSSSSNTLEEFTVTIEYEWSDEGDAKDVAEILTANGILTAKNIIGAVQS